MSTTLIWLIAAVAIAGVLFRPRGWPEAVWACLGAFLLVASGLLPWTLAGAAIAKGLDVYLFLTGMMLLSELARREGVFDWLASLAVKAASGDAARLFLLIYLVGTAVTVFLSNDATAVVLTPAVYAAVKKAGTKTLPYLLICAFIANAASFVLPISNPANLVVYGKHLPALLPWLRTFLLPSVCSILVTYATLRWISREDLGSGGAKKPLADAAVKESHRDSGLTDESVCPTVLIKSSRNEWSRRFCLLTDFFTGPDARGSDGKAQLSREGRFAAWGIVATGAVLIGASGFGLDLGLPTCIAATATVLLVTRAHGKALAGILNGVSWSVLPLVAGLFVLVEAVNRAGALHSLGGLLESCAQLPKTWGALAASFGIAGLSNVVNNLPSGLLAGGALQTIQAPGHIRDAVLIGVDLGPNLSVTGSLATVLWLIALRREGEHISGWQFLKAGLIVMPPALLLATLAIAIS